jgi:hypothetical protein
MTSTPSKFLRDTFFLVSNQVRDYGCKDTKTGYLNNPYEYIIACQAAAYEFDFFHIKQKDTYPST